MIVGGGSGGHITPAIAVVRELLQLKPRLRVEFWTDRKYYKNVVKTTTELGVKWGDETHYSNAKPYIRVRKVMSGKFHRYAGWNWRDYFINWQITIKDLIVGNIVGLCGFIGGMISSFFRLFSKKNRPDAMFLKGGFVCLPVGVIAKIFKIPYVIHESDAVPGLANRLLMKKATVVCTGLSLEDEQSKMIFTGTPVAPEFHPMGTIKQKSLKKTLGFDENKPLLMITGGSQGSKHINEAVREILPELLQFTSVGLIAGRERYEEMVDLKKYEQWDNAHLQSNFRLWEFSTTMDELMGAADVVVSRAGATTIAELAALKKAVVLVPFESLPGGHQVKNAKRLEKLGAVVSVLDSKMVEHPDVLLQAVKTTIKSPKKQEKLADNLHKQAKPDAALHLAKIVLDVASGKEVAEIK